MLAYNTHMRKTEACLYYKLTNDPKGSGELKKACVPSEDSDEPTHLCTLIRLHCPHEQALNP